MAGWKGAGYGLMRLAISCRVSLELVIRRRFMSKLCRSSLYVFSFLVIAAFASTANGECWNECNPYFSSCDQYCDVCIQQGIDGCIDWAPSTCGQSSGGCIPSNCTPDWDEVSRVTHGTYDGRSLWGCNHHVVQWVTLTDNNECNVNSYFYTYSFCDNVIDDYKNGCCYPSCCEGVGELNTQLECDGDHTCD